MMSEVKRYRMTLGGDWDEPYPDVEEHDNGTWVAHSDYAKLAAKVEELEDDLKKAKERSAEYIAATDPVLNNLERISEERDALAAKVEELETELGECCSCRLDLSTVDPGMGTAKTKQVCKYHLNLKAKVKELEFAIAAEVRRFDNTNELVDGVTRMRKDIDWKSLAWAMASRLRKEIDPALEAEDE